MGLGVGLLAAVYLCVIVLKTILFRNPVAGYPSLIAVVLFLGSAQLITPGVIGEYLGRVFNKAKNRPLYFVERHLPSESAGERSSGDARELPDPIAKSLAAGVWVASR
jgi:hypothetical protein